MPDRIHTPETTSDNLIILPNLTIPLLLGEAPGSQSVLNAQRILCSLGLSPRLDIRNEDRTGTQNFSLP